VIVVDDGSTDDTLAVARRVAHRSPRVHVEALERNSGKTAAVARGIEVASAEIVVIQDADLEYDPAEIPAVIDPILRGEADVVYGSRFLVRRAARVLYFYHFVANKVLTFLSNLLTNRNMTDIETCYKAMRSGVIKPLVLTSKGFGMEVEITALISKTHARTYEVPISYHGRTYAEGKKIGISDGLAAIGYILRYNLVTPWMPRGRKYIKAVNRFLAGVSTPQTRIDPPIIPRPTVPSPHWPTKPAETQPGHYSDVA
jgi:glycosyltransferase involved in cell wall biosynthesis